MSESNITAYVSYLFTFSSWLIMSHFSSMPIVFHQFFTWIALGDVDLRFSLKLVRKASPVKGEIKLAAQLHHQHNPYT
jgi:hypothetical protein